MTTHDRKNRKNSLTFFILILMIQFVKYTKGEIETFECNTEFNIAATIT